MLRPVRESAAPASETWSIPAPVGGWNARDALAQMRPTDAIQLDNWFPGTTTVDVRQGSTQTARLPGGEAIKTLMGVSNANGDYVRFAATASGIYNITAGGVIAAVDSAATTGEWESVQINVGDISYLWCCAGDGINKSRIYNSTTDTWTELDGVSVPALTGVNSENVSHVSLWKYRLILCERGTLKFYYGPLNSVGGAFSAFDLGQVFKKGGHLVATANWTIDAGDGADDRFVAISSEGECAIFQGTDPSASSTFDLVGVYNLGKPTGKRCFVQLAGDLGVLVEQGLWPLSRALQSSTVDRRLALTDKIQAAFNSYYNLYKSEFGWQAVLLPKGPALLVNVPIANSNSYQFVMNLITGAWCRFTDWAASCLMVLDGKLYRAVENTVYEAWTGTSDSDSAISAVAATAYTYGPTRLRAKKLKMVRPQLQVGSPVEISTLINTNFQAAQDMALTPSEPSGGSLWDSAVFDVDPWGGLLQTQASWRVVTHFPGRAFSLQLGVQVRDIVVTWAQTDFISETTGVSLA
jgi:hypothetical protein